MVYHDHSRPRYHLKIMSREKKEKTSMHESFKEMNVKKNKSKSLNAQNILDDLFKLEIKDDLLDYKEILQDLSSLDIKTDASIPKIIIRNVKFYYKNGVRALDNITFDIERGDIIGIIGPNGSGKSTLIRILDGILKPKFGTILIENKTLNRYTLGELARLVSYVSQDGGIIFPTSVFNVVLLGRKPYIEWGGPSKNDVKIAAEVLDQLKLGKLAMRGIDELSGGQRQKVFIARALAQKTSIILLDEPTANLDLNHQLEILEILKEETLKGTVVIMATHDLNLVAKYCNKFIILESGKVIAAGGKEILTKEIIERVFKVKVKIIHENDSLFFIVENLIENDSNVVNTSLKEKVKVDNSRPALKLNQEYTIS
ncbi:MAG: ABC transporter ATP-binding protein [Promethearchaeota archaeon]